MNGIGLLVLISLFGQIGQPPVLETEKDFGWQINPDDGVLEYIIQLSPDTISLMQRTQQEKMSEIPNELVGRVTRTVVRIGTEVLPRTPSLLEIAKMPRFGSATDMQAQLDPGRFSDVEAIKNVQQTEFPQLPSGYGGLQNSLSDAADNLIDRVGAAAPALPDIANSFLDSARNGSSAAIPNRPAANPIPNPALANPALPKRFQDTAPPAGGFPSTSPASPAPYGNASNNATVNNATSGTNAPANRDFSWDTPTSRTADTRTGNSYPAPRVASPNDPISLNGGGYPSSGGYPNSGNQNVGNPSGLGFGVSPNGQMPGSNLNDAIRQSQLMNQREQEIYASSQNASRQNASTPPSYEELYFQRYGTFPPQGAAPQGVGNPAGFDGNVTRLASNNGPTQSGSATNNASSASDNSSGNKEATNNTTTAGAPDNILLVFFLLSLIVNCYLGGLIRKLLTRYRSLLSSVRGQSFDAA